MSIYTQPTLPFLIAFLRRASAMSEQGYANAIGSTRHDEHVKEFHAMLMADPIGWFRETNHDEIAAVFKYLKIENQVRQGHL